MNTLVILNPISGKSAGTKYWPSIETALHKAGIHFDLARTTRPQEAIAITEAAKRAGYKCFIAIGGDGTVHEVTNGLMRATQGGPSGILGVIPVGSGNDFAKMLNLKPDWQEGVRKIAAGQTRWLDVGRVVGDKPAPGFSFGAHYFANGLDTGFGAIAAMHARSVPFLHGTAIYLAAVVKTLWGYSVPRVRIEFDANCAEQPSTMIAVSNGRCIGGGFWVTPNASVADGMFDIMIANGLGRIGIMTLIPKVMNGKHVGDSRVRFVQASRVIIESPDPLVVETDGEIPFVDAHRLEIENLPKRLQVIT